MYTHFHFGYKSALGLFLLVFFLSCRFGVGKAFFAGYQYFPLSPGLSYNTVPIDPVFEGKLIFHEGVDSTYYWEKYAINKLHGIYHFCSSYNALIVENAQDFLIIDKDTIPVSSLFEGRVVKYRIMKMHIINYKDIRYFLLLGQDMFEGGNRYIENIAILISCNQNNLKAISPPFTLNFLQRDGEPDVLPLCFNDFNRDGKLDFLQWNTTDSILLYSLEANTLVKQKHFLQVSCVNDLESDSVSCSIDLKKSNWPYLIPGIKSETVLSLYSCEKGINLKSGYY